MSDATEVKQSDIYIHHQSGKAFILAELHDRIAAELKAELFRVEAVAKAAVECMKDRDLIIARQARVIEKLKEKLEEIR